MINRQCQETTGILEIVKSSSPASPVSQSRYPPLMKAAFTLPFCSNRFFLKQLYVGWLSLFLPLLQCCLLLQLHSISATLGSFRGVDPETRQYNAVLWGIVS